jgi:hypothetical protein
MVGHVLRRIGLGILVFFLTAGAFGAIGIALDLNNRIGDKATGAYSLCGIAVGVILGIGMALEARWARIICGSAIALFGFGAALFFLWDFISSLFTHYSVIQGYSGGDLGKIQFAMFGMGGGLGVAGLLLALRQTKKQVP